MFFGGDIYETVDQQISAAKIEAGKVKGVRNNLFFLNVVVSDGMSSKTQSIDINILKLRQLLDAEEIPNDFSALYEVK